MPGFDKTGPMGQGPMTGRQLGYCSRSAMTNETDAAILPGRGLGNRYGRGLRGRGFYRQGQFSRYLPGETRQEGVSHSYHSALDELRESIKRLEKEILSLKDRP